MLEKSEGIDSLRFMSELEKGLHFLKSFLEAIRSNSPILGVHHPDPLDVENLTSNKKFRIFFKRN